MMKIHLPALPVSRLLRSDTFLRIFLPMLLSMGLLGVRMLHSHSFHFLFLVWNLFLAFLPWLFALGAEKALKQGRRTLLWLGAWLLFFPNAPYLLTDLIHLKVNPYAPEWYDLFLLLSFAWTGVALGLDSLMRIERVVRVRAGAKSAPWLRNLFLVMAGYGVYLGRFERWNSWDIVSDPFSLLRAMADHFLHPLAHSRVFSMTLVLAAFLWILYQVYARPASRRS